MAIPITEIKSKKDDRSLALKLSGAGYIVGDIAGVGAAWARYRHTGEKNFGTALGFATWFAGGAAAAVFGSPSNETQIKITAHKFQNYLQEHNILIPEDVRGQSELLKKPNFLNAAVDFLHEHPSEMLNTMFAIGAAFLFKRGIDRIGSDKKIFPALPNAINAKELSDFAARTNTRFWMGALVGAGALSGLFIKEDPTAREKAENGDFTDKVLAYIKEKPLRLTSLLYGINNIFSVLDVVSDYHLFKNGKFPQPYLFSGTTAATYIISNMLLHSVSRDQSVGGGFDAAEMARLEEMAATVIASQPAEKQQQALQEVSAFLATQKNIHLQAPQIAEHLAQRIAEHTKTQLLTVPATPLSSGFAAKEAARRSDAAELIVPENTIIR